MLTIRLQMLVQDARRYIRRLFEPRIHVIYQLEYQWYDSPENDGFETFIKEATLPFLPPVGTEVFIFEEEMDIETKGESYDDCQQTEVARHSYQMDKDGSINYSGFYVHLKIQGDDGALKAKDIGDHGNPHLFAKLLEKAGWKKI